MFFFRFCFIYFVKYTLKLNDVENYGLVKANAFYLTVFIFLVNNNWLTLIILLLILWLRTSWCLFKFGVLLLYRPNGLVDRVFANGLGKQLNHTKISKMVRDAALLNTQYNNVRIKGKVGQSSDRSCAPHFTSVL